MGDNRHGLMDSRVLGILYLKITLSGEGLVFFGLHSINMIFLVSTKLDGIDFFKGIE